VTRCRAKAAWNADGTIITPIDNDRSPASRRSGGTPAAMKLAPNRRTDGHVLGRTTVSFLAELATIFVGSLDSPDRPLCSTPAKEGLRRDTALHQRLLAPALML
jgi:hypothetical protein